MLLFDAHAHVADERFDEDRAEVIARMAQAGVAKCMLCCDPTDEPFRVAETFRLAAETETFYCAMCIHPHNAKEWSDEIEQTIRAHLAKKRCMALGEIGLDYYYDSSPREAQREAFARQLEIAYELSKPAVLHIRDAFGDAMDILGSAYKAGRLPSCQMHCFSGSWETARQCLNMGMVISFSGSVTFKNGVKLIESAKNTPIDRILVETDCPYLSPEPKRGRRNEPAHVAYTAARVAELRGMDADEFARAAYDNACRFFKIAD